MFDTSFNNFTPPYTDTENRSSRSPVTLETLPLPIQLIEIKKNCEEYQRKSYLTKLLTGPKVITQIIELNNQFHDRILTINRNVTKTHSSLEDLAVEVETLEKKLSVKNNESPQGHFQFSSKTHEDRLSALEVEQRELRSRLNDSRGSMSILTMLLWGLGITAINILVSYGIINSIGN